ncbi:MAG: hypothetical protein RI544_06230 [Haloquadratum sp.]|jgi:hypothetical protein|nr:hypothetical protein [Haloquadratum sp.]
MDHWPQAAALLARAGHPAAGSAAALADGAASSAAPTAGAVILAAIVATATDGSLEGADLAATVDRLRSAPDGDPVGPLLALCDPTADHRILTARLRAKAARHRRARGDLEDLFG